MGKGQKLLKYQQQKVGLTLSRTVTDSVLVVYLLFHVVRSDSNFGYFASNWQFSTLYQLLPKHGNFLMFFNIVLAILRKTILATLLVIHNLEFVT